MSKCVGDAGTLLAAQSEKKDGANMDKHAQKAGHLQKSIVVSLRLSWLPALSCLLQVLHLLCLMGIIFIFVLFLPTCQKYRLGYLALLVEQEEEHERIEEQEQRQESSESEELGAVDFMDSDDEQRLPVVLDSRFDSSSDDDEAAPLCASDDAVPAAAQKASALQRPGSQKDLGVAKQQAEMPFERVAQAAEPRRSKGSTGSIREAAEMVEAHPQRVVRMAAMPGEEESDSSGGEAEGVAHAAARIKPPAPHPEQADSREGEEGRKDAAAGIMSPAAQQGNADSSEVSASGEVGSSSAHSSSSGDVRGSSTNTGSAASEEVSGSLGKQDSDKSLEEHPIHGGDVEVGPIGGQRHELADEMTGAEMQQSDSEQDGEDTQESDSLGDKAGVSREYDQAVDARDCDNAAEDQLASDGGTDSDLEQAGSALRAAPREEQANCDEASTDILSGGCHTAANLLALCCASRESSARLTC